MTTQSLIHSNAFNFMSFLQGSVDERTGQYALNIDLPALASDALSGPSLPLRLSFNPLNTVNSGFGVGWTLLLSQYDLDTHALDLHTGQRFTISDNGPGQPAPVPERKLEQFYFENISGNGSNRYRVAYKSGIVELLETLPTDPRLALPVRVLADSGHGITLTYHPQKKGCLESIIDDTGRTLLKIDYRGNESVELTLLPQSPMAAVYRLEFSANDLASVVLPTSNNARWTMTYGTFGELRCLTRLETPLGATEIIDYEASGHYFPGSRERALPYVRRHEVQPGAGQDNQQTTYTFTAENFLGYNALNSWEDNGMDNLYKVADRTYRYGSTATHYQGGVPVRTVERVFNRFHLLTEQVTREQGCIQRSETVYHERDVEFADQPKYFQLPRTETQSWAREGDATPPRSETVTTEYDDYGNQTLEQQPSGIRTERTYLPKDADPEGFVRHLEQETVRPAQDQESGAPTLCTRYRYQLLPPVSRDSGVPLPGWLVNGHEEQYRLNADGSQTQLQQIERVYIDTPLDSFGHGRLKQELTSRNGRQTTIDYAYALVETPDEPGTHPRVETKQVITGFDHGPGSHAQKEITLWHSVLIGEPLLNRDDNDVEIEYEYDLLRRVVRETVAPRTVYEASRNYSYTLVAQRGGQASQTQVDVKGVSTLGIVDGLNRLVEAWRDDPDIAPQAQQQDLRKTYTAKYDGLGNLVEEVEIDWHQDVDVPLAKAYSYDGWGQRCTEVGPDKVVHHTQIDPIGNPQRLGPVHRDWRESADGLSSGRTVTAMNLFGEPITVERLDADLAPYSEHHYFYDGLGRKVREVDAGRHEMKFGYDEFDRLVDHTLADGAVVHRVYALHSTEDLPELIEVTRRGGDQPSVLGLQRFDGLDRLAEVTTGGRVRTQLFDPGQRQPSEVITPKGNRIKYEYRSSLSEEPVLRHQIETDVKANFNYDPENARLMSCSEHGVAMTRDYFTTGELKSETCSFDGDEPYTMAYVHSLQGALLSYTDVLGAVQHYEYDPAARLQRTQLGQLTSTFEYDGLGRNDYFNTVDASAGEQPRSLGTRLKFDDFDREIVRTFNFGDSQQTLEQHYDSLDRITLKLLCEGETVLRRETFEYDERGRLVEYTCSGVDEYLPVDPYGNRIQSQTFAFDAIDNITRVLTRHALGRVDILYHFTNEKDPAQLQGFTVRGVDDAPIEVLLEYDADGNLTRDEEGRAFIYDALGRLQSVDGIDYRYDPLDRLISQALPAST